MVNDNDSFFTINRVNSKILESCAKCFKCQIIITQDKKKQHILHLRSWNKKMLINDLL